MIEKLGEAWIMDIINILDLIISIICPKNGYSNVKFCKSIEILKVDKKKFFLLIKIL
jgi:hypothetical protein